MRKRWRDKLNFIPDREPDPVEENFKQEYRNQEHHRGTIAHQSALADPFNNESEQFVYQLMMQTLSEVGNTSGQLKDASSTENFSQGVEGSSKMVTPSRQGKL